MEINHRHTPRVHVNSPGTVLVNGASYAFRTCDLSLGGSLIHLDQEVRFEAGTHMEIRLEDMGFCAQGHLCWARPDPAGGTLLGLKFERLEGGR